MSLKTAFAAVLKAMRNSRGLTQKHLSDASSRTYLSKLERAQSSLTLDKLQALSQTLELSPLTLVAITVATESRAPLRDILNRLETELVDLRRSGVLKDLGIDFDVVTKASRAATRVQPDKTTMSTSLQAELLFSD
ncbi:helix-turn-helix domain-containing protein [Pseudomonas syringae]|uniref:helix-turn-helix domain-containing protein n=1 Tax=Pseudomonas syringae TaxID=317 RepID=UPI001F204EA4|nr:helix-turn-helix transcriptional regulator [Pseudomonas syringae]MCF5226938.1 helix-turn-helix domain-containing protein [Pseudomonas syringae]MCF5244595.1 helix-turn-helix domain-containing protein [Pseudomonas syringae]